ncbi:hypothetical protein RKD31_003688 [Streptomyces sp. SAI-163]
MNRNSPNMPMTASIIVRKHPARLRSRMTCSGSRGVGARVCHHTKAASRTTARANRASTSGSVQPRGWASLKP